MRVLFDTNVLVAALAEAHPMHERSRLWLERAVVGGLEGFVSTHSLAETYSILSKLPVQPPFTPGQAYAAIHDSVESVLEPVVLSASDYHAVIKDLAEAELSGGIVYDALIVRAAQKAEVDHLLTFNLRHFQRVWQDDKGIVREP